MLKKLPTNFPVDSEATDQLLFRYSEFFQIFEKNGFHEVDNTSTDFKKTYDSIIRKFRMTVFITSFTRENN